MDMLLYTPVDFNYLETLAKIFIISARQYQLVQENILSKAPVRRLAIAMKTNPAFTRSFTRTIYTEFKLHLHLESILV